jgi:hypothetical protein
MNSFDQLNCFFLTMLSPVGKHTRSHDRIPLSFRIGFIEMPDLKVAGKLQTDSTVAHFFFTGTLK